MYILYIKVAILELVVERSINSLWLFHIECTTQDMHAILFCILLVMLWHLYGSCCLFYPYENQFRISSGLLQSGVFFKDVNPLLLAKRPLKITGHLGNRELASLVK